MSIESERDEGSLMILINSALDLSCYYAGSMLILDLRSLNQSA